MEKGYEVTCLAEISLANTLKGGTPSFTDAMDMEEGQKIYQYILDKMRRNYDEDKVKRKCIPSNCTAYKPFLMTFLTDVSFYFIQVYFLPGLHYNQLPNYLITFTL